MLLIGSRAANFHFSDFSRSPKDYDFIAENNQEVNSFLKKFPHKDTSIYSHKRKAQVKVNKIISTFEFDLADKIPSSKILLENENSFGCQDPEFKCSYNIASPLSLFLIKRSHITRNIHFQKNINDYLFLKNKIDFKKMKSFQHEMFELRFNEVKNRVHKKQINFDVSNSDFFRKSEKFVNRIVEHDSLHWATCFFEEPIFFSCKDDLSKAELSINKVAKHSDEIIIKMIQEEIMALSLERYILPAIKNNQTYNQKEIVYKMACKMVYNYLPEFLRLFAADNFDKIYDINHDFVKECFKRHPNLYRELPFLHYDQ